MTAVLGLMYTANVFAWDEPLKDIDDYYVIETKEHLLWLSNAVNENKMQDIKAKLVNDIVFNDGVMTKESENVTIWEPLGGNGKINKGKIYNFRGVIDGQGHTISGLYCTDTYVAGLVSVNIGTIRNLGIINSYFYAQPNNQDDWGYSGSFAGENLDNGAIENCFARNNIVDGEYISGGITAIGDTSARIENCYTSCNVSSALASSASKYRKYADAICYYDDCGTVTNVYWENGKTVSYVSGALSFDTEFAARGALCYKLNQDGVLTSWRQNITDFCAPFDDYPVLNTSHYCVYLDDGVYTNRTDDPSVYHGGEGGGGEVTGDIEMNEDGFYEIYNTEHLYQFSDLVNDNPDKKDAKAILKNDITVNYDKITDQGSYRQWVPIGNVNAEYKGIFDGDCHTISGLYGDNMLNELEYSGLFGCIGEGADIRNVGVINSYFYSSISTGAISAACHGGSIINCFARDDVILGEAYMGGIAGQTDQGTMIADCFFVRGSINKNKSSKYYPVNAIVAGNMGNNGNIYEYTGASECYYYRIDGTTNVTWSGVTKLNGGDVDMNGQVNVVDAIRAMNMLYEIDENRLAYFLADFDCEGNVTETDVALILRAAAGLPN